MSNSNHSVHSGRIASPPPKGPANYAGGSIANLAVTLARSFGASAGGNPLSESIERSANLTERLEQAATVVLVVLDGVGTAQLERHVPDGCLVAHQSSRLTSVFPSSTAPAITSLLTGVAPAEHGTPAWFIHHQRPDTIFRSLPMDVRGDPASAAPVDLWSWKGWMGQASGDFYGFQPHAVCGSTYSQRGLEGAQRIGYRQSFEILGELGKIVRQPGEGRRFAYLYLPHFDTIAHQYGCESQQASRCLRGMDAWFEQLLNTVQNTSTLVVAVADHGFIDISPDAQYRLGDLPEIQRCLSAPLAGEPRTVFCRVATGHEAQFAQALASSPLAAVCDAYLSDDLLQAGWFGPVSGSTPVCEDFSIRIGTHTLVMRDGYTLVDAVVGEQSHHFVGMHGGVTSAEMTVPLIVADSS